MDRSTAITLGIVFLVAGAAAFFWAGPHMDLVRSGLGQLAIAMGGEASRQQADLWQTAYYGGIVGMVLGAIMLVSALIRPAGERESVGG